MPNQMRIIVHHLLFIAITRTVTITRSAIVHAAVSCVLHYLSPLIWSQPQVQDFLGPVWQYTMQSASCPPHRSRWARRVARSVLAYPYSWRYVSPVSCWVSLRSNSYLSLTSAMLLMVGHSTSGGGGKCRGMVGASYNSCTSRCTPARAHSSLNSLKRLIFMAHTRTSSPRLQRVQAQRKTQYPSWESDPLPCSVHPSSFLPQFGGEQEQRSRGLLVVNTSSVLASMRPFDATCYRLLQPLHPPHLPAP